MKLLFITFGACAAYASAFSPSMLHRGGCGYTKSRSPVMLRSGTELNGSKTSEISTTEEKAVSRRTLDFRECSLPRGSSVLYKEAKRAPPLPPSLAYGSDELEAWSIQNTHNVEALTAYLGVVEEDDTQLPDGTVFCNSIVDESTPEQAVELAKVMEAYMWFSSLHTSYVNIAAADLTSGHSVVIMGVEYEPSGIGGLDKGLSQNAAKVSGPILNWLFTQIQVAYNSKVVSRSVKQEQSAKSISVDFVLSILSTIMTGISINTLTAIAKTAAGQTKELAISYSSDQSEVTMSAVTPIVYWNQFTNTPGMALTQYQVGMSTKTWEVVVICPTQYGSTTTRCVGNSWGIDVKELMRLHADFDGRGIVSENFLKKNSGKSIADMNDSGAKVDFS